MTFGGEQFVGSCAIIANVSNPLFHKCKILCKKKDFLKLVNILLRPMQDVDSDRVNQNSDTYKAFSIFKNDY